jgi:transcription antitermination factor NusG
MFPQGQRVEIVAGAFAGMIGVVAARDEVQRHNLQRADNLPPAENEALVVLTMWGHEVVVSLTSEEVRAI